MENDGVHAYSQREAIQPADTTYKHLTAADYAGFRFFLSLGLMVFSLVTLGITWAVLSTVSAVLGLIWTWLFWVLLGGCIGIGLPHVCWRAYKYGVFD